MITPGKVAPGSDLRLLLRAGQALFPSEQHLTRAETMLLRGEDPQGALTAAGVAPELRAVMAEAGALDVLAQLNALAPALARRQHARARMRGMGTHAAVLAVVLAIAGMVTHGSVVSAATQLAPAGWTMVRWFAALVSLACVVGLAGLAWSLWRPGAAGPGARMQRSQDVATLTATTHALVEAGVALERALRAASYLARPPTALLARTLAHAWSTGAPVPDAGVRLWGHAGAALLRECVAQGQVLAALDVLEQATWQQSREVLRRDGMLVATATVLLGAVCLLSTALAGLGAYVFVLGG